MEAVRKLTVDIMSYLKGNGFKKLEDEIDKGKKGFLGMESLSASTFLKMGAGIFSVTKLMGEYNKAIQAVEYQVEQETKLYSSMKAHGFREEQIESIKAYAGELQGLGVVGDDVTLAGVQQLAVFNLTEKSLKSLMPAMQNIIVQQKGLNGTGQDAVGVANMLAKGLQGQTGMLLKAGISLTKRQEQMIKVGTEEQKVAALVEAVTMNVGEQNKAFAATPEGKIAQVQNRIGDIYKSVGFRLRKSRYEWFAFLGDNLEGAEKFVIAGIDTLELLKDGAMGTAKGIYKAFSDMPDDAQNMIKLIGGFFAITAFPVVAAVGVITDIIGAFNGQKSITEDVFNALMNYLDYDYNFEGFKKEIKELWKAFDEGGWVAAFLQNLQASIGLIGDGLVIIGGLGKGIITGDFDLAKKGVEKAGNRINGNNEYLTKFIDSKREVPSLPVKVPIGADGIDYNKPLLDNPFLPIPKKYDFLEQEIQKKYLLEKQNIDIPKLKPISLETGLKNNYEKKETVVNIKIEQKNNTKIEGSRLSQTELEEAMKKVNKNSEEEAVARLKSLYGEGVNDV